MLKTYQILTNLSCNLRCKYCYEKNKAHRVNKTEDIKEYLDALFERDFGIRYENEETPRIMIEFIGGESFLCPELLDRTMEHAKELFRIYEIKDDLLASISTNGTLLSNPKVREFVLKWKEHLSIGISIDGTQELHDACRVYHDGRGSYKDAVEGWNWLKTVMPPYRVGVKATYCHDTISQYGDGVINLIKLGLTDISANVIYEEIWTEDDALVIAQEMKKVVDYIFENGLEDKLHVRQINPSEIDMMTYNPYSGTKDTNYCGTCTYMTCLGFDKKLYGCNRMCTMERPIQLGEVKNGRIEISGEGRQFIKEIKEQYKHWHPDCLECRFGSQCPMCSIIPYEVYPDDPDEFHANKPQCGFTKACVWARSYFRNRLLEK